MIKVKLMFALLSHGLALSKTSYRACCSIIRAEPIERS